MDIEVQGRDAKAHEVIMIIIGHFDTTGNPVDYKEAIKVAVFGRTLRDDNGMIWGIQDSVGDWVHPTMYSFGSKCKLRFTDFKADTSASS